MIARFDVILTPNSSFIGIGDYRSTEEAVNGFFLSLSFRLVRGGQDDSRAGASFSIRRMVDVVIA